MKQAVLLVGLLLACLTAAPAAAEPFQVACTSTSWTTVAAARQVRRTVRLHGLYSNAYGICVGTITASGSTCGDTTSGVEISTVTGNIMQFELQTNQALTCRSRTGSTGEKLKGY